MNENQKAFEVADVFNASGNAYIENHRLSYEQRKAIEDIQKCNIRDSFFRGISGKEWVVYCKEPFDNPNNLIEYLGRYTHRIAISNHRIIGVTENTVSFHYNNGILDCNFYNHRRLLSLQG
ncbi:MAG: transposase [Leptospiraceae bacterium]|nr:transposase [Leptospiraceae bacterium]